MNLNICSRGNKQATSSGQKQWQDRGYFSFWFSGYFLPAGLFVCGLSSQSTAMVMSRRSVNLTTLFTWASLD